MKVGSRPIYLFARLEPLLTNPYLYGNVYL
jgi:hypothetical protein